MNTTNIPKILENLQPDLKQITDQEQKETLSTLLNMVEVSVYN